MSLSFRDMLAARKASETSVNVETVTEVRSTLAGLHFVASTEAATLSSNGESYYINGTINGNKRVTVFFRYANEDFRLVDALTQEPKAWVLMLDFPAVVVGNRVNVYPSGLADAAVTAESIEIDPKLKASLALALKA